MRVSEGLAEGVYLWEDIKQDAQTSRGGIVQLSDGLGVDHHH